MNRGFFVSYETFYKRIEREYLFINYKNIKLSL